MDSVLHSPLLQRDVVGVVASFLTVFHLRRSFLRVSKLWFEIGTEIVKGMNCIYLWFGNLQTK